jgi:hypothetical protein
MSDLALVLETDDENPVLGDLRLVDGQLVLVEGKDAIRQDLTVRLRWFRAEWFLDRRTGVPWFQKIIGQRTGLQIVEAIIRNAILSTPGIEAISRLTLSSSSAPRELSIDFEARSTDGDRIVFRDFVIDPPTPEENAP